MKISDEYFCKESTYILECLLRQDPDHFLQGDWYDMFPESTIDLVEGGSVQVSIVIPAIEVTITGVIANHLSTEVDFGTTYKCINMDKVSLYVQGFSDRVYKPIKIKRDVKHILVKKMREAFYNRDKIFEIQAFNVQDVFDGNDLIGLR